MMFFKKKRPAVLPPKMPQISLCSAYQNENLNTSDLCHLTVPKHYQVALKIERKRPSPVVEQKKAAEPAPTIVRNGPISSDPSGIISVIGLSASK